MAGKTARSNAKRMKKFSEHPHKVSLNKAERAKRYIKRLEKKIAKYPNREGLKRELSFVAGKATRPAIKTGRDARIIVKQYGAQVRVNGTWCNIPVNEMGRVSFMMKGQGHSRKK